MPDCASEDIVARRRTSFWSRIYRLGLVFASLFTVIYVVKLFAIGHDVSWGAPGATIWHSFDNAVTHPSKTVQLGFNFIILGLSGVAIYVLPMLIAGVSQIRSSEPGDTDWGVKLDDVRGQAEAKEESPEDRHGSGNPEGSSSGRE